MTHVKAYAAMQQGAALEPYEYELPQLDSDGVNIRVHYCGICHSDISMIDNEWGMSQYPLVPGHEVIGEVVEVGSHVKNIQIGDMVGLGWFSKSCTHCHECMSGSHNLCATAEQTIVGRHGGFADHIQAHWSWVTKLPEGIDASKAGPLLCGGITVFNPLDFGDVRPTDTVGVIGIGGLGHMALKFLQKWGCEVIAFSSNPDKTDEIKGMGATKVINSRDPEAMQEVAGTLDMIINTVNVNLDWSAYINLLGPNGRFHSVGAIPDPIQVHAMQLIMKQRSLSGSPLGSPALTKTMLNFCARHDIHPTVEEFQFDDINQALDHVRSGKARYRAVLKMTS